MPISPIFMLAPSFMGMLWLRISRRMTPPSKKKNTTLIATAMDRKPGVRWVMV